MPKPRPAEVRFLEKVRKTDDCWLWTGSLNKAGYGHFKPRSKQSPVRAHRWSYELHVGPIPDGAQLDHLCRVRSCVNPEHLEPVSNRENTLRSTLSLGGANARKTHCIHGHEFTPENTYVKSGRHGHPERVCIACKRARRRAS